MTTPPDTGSHAVDVPKKRSLAWLWILLGVLLLALLAWWLLDDDGDDMDASPTVVTEQTEEPTVDETEEPLAEETEEPQAGETTEPEPTGDGSAAATVGLVMVGETDLLAEDADPLTLVGESVEAQDVVVQALVADEAFLVGPSPERTVLVRIVPFAGANEPESPVDVSEGDTVSFTGTVAEWDEAVRADMQLVDEEALAGNAGQVYVQINELEITS